LLRKREYLFALMAFGQKGTMPINAGDQTTKIKIQITGAVKNLPNLVSTVISTQCLFTSADNTHNEI